MVRIIICDDNLPFAEALSHQISGMLLPRNIRPSIRICGSEEDFLAEIEQEAPNIIFMDLLLNGSSDGYDLAEKLRRERLNCEIVFITNYPERMQDAFAFRPIGFIPKPVSDEVIEAVLDRYFSFYYPFDNNYVLNSRNHSLRVPLADILYFESVGHTVKLYRKSEGEPLVQTCRLDEIAAELEEHGFIRIHKSFLVHMHAIERIDRSSLHAILTNGASLPISRSCYNGLIEKFIHFRLR